MTGNVRAAASEKIPNLSMVRTTEGLYQQKDSTNRRTLPCWESCGCQRQRDARVPYGYIVTLHSVLDLQKSDFSFLKLFLQRYAVTYFFTLFFFSVFTLFDHLSTSNCITNPSVCNSKLVHPSFLALRCTKQDPEQWRLGICCNPS